MSKIFACFPDSYSDVSYGEINLESTKMWLGKVGQYSINQFNNHYNQLRQMQVIPIHSIPANTPYNIFIKCRGYEGVDTEVLKKIGQLQLAFVFAEIINNMIKSPHYKKILHDSKLGLVNWWFDYGWEKLIIRNRKQEEYWEDLWSTLLDCLNCNDHPKNINYITGAEPCEEYETVIKQSGINVVFANPFETCNIGFLDKNHDRYDNYTEFLNIQSSAIEQKNPNYTHALLYNRVPRPLRALLLSYLEETGNLEKTFYSWGGWPVVYGSTEQEKNATINTWTRDIDYLYEETGKKYRSQCIEWFRRDTVELFDEKDAINLKENQATGVNLIHPFSCNFQIVTETCYNRLPFLTEKTFKPITQLMPFVILSPGAGCIKGLRDRGYRTYDKWIDHSYDNPGSFDERFRLFSAEIDRLYNFTPQEWAEIRREMLPDMLYNVNHLAARGNMSQSYIFYK